MGLRRRTSKIPRSRRAKKEIDHYSDQQTMHYQLKGCVQRTQDNVVPEPNDKQPARPITATKYE
jgi:hypothetical protein